MAAALAYYTFLALAPLLVLSVLIAGAVIGEAAAQGEIVEQTRSAIGRRAGEAVQDILQNAGRPGEGIAAFAIGLLVLLFGVYRAFHELQKGLGRILGGPGGKSGARKGLLRRLVSLGLVLSVGPVLLMVTIGGTALDAARNFLRLTPGLLLFRLLDTLLAFGLCASLLALLYRYVPDRRRPWKQIWLGAGVSAGLFVLARSLVGLYIERSSITSAYGAAGLFVILLVGVHFCAQVLYVGAELARLRGDLEAGPDASEERLR